MLCKAIIRALNTNYKYNLISYDKTTRHETQPYPDVAIREGIYNSLMHNDWSACQLITINVFDLKMEISNRAVIPSGWTIENHDSMHINPLISNAFKYAGFVEKFGTGIPKMLNACKADGNPEPEYKVYEKSLFLVLKPSEKYMLLVEQLYGKNPDDVLHNEDVGKDNVLLSKESSKSPVIRRNTILDLIRSNPTITIPEIAIIQKVSARTIERDFDWLEDKGIIIREGSRADGDGRWIIVD